MPYERGGRSPLRKDAVSFARVSPGSDDAVSSIAFVAASSAAVTRHKRVGSRHSLLTTVANNDNRYRVDVGDTDRPLLLSDEKRRLGERGGRFIRRSAKREGVCWCGTARMPRSLGKICNKSLNPGAFLCELHQLRAIVMSYITVPRVSFS